MRSDSGDEDFVTWGIRWLHGLRDVEVADWDHVLRSSPGYFPGTLFDLWTAELRRRGIAADFVDRAPALHRGTPISHPLDYDWRFTSSTAASLVQAVTRALEARPRSLVAHLGSPSTFVHAVEHSHSHPHTLIERNPAMIGALDASGHNIVQLDLLQQAPPYLSAAAAILDPPWYPLDSLAFVHAAALICEPGAVVYLCQPTLATRPGIEQERRQLLADLPVYGFDLQHVHENAARYVTPHFEAMSLRSAVHRLQAPTDWRTGDIFELRRNRCSPPVFVPRSQNDADVEWIDAEFDIVRIKLRDAGGHDLESIVANDVLDSVSRRDPIRKDIGFWTSGNRVFALSRPKLIGTLISLCDSDYMNANFSLDRMTAEAIKLGLGASLARRLFDVLLVELQEHHAYRRMINGR